jgi:hypothetical protein
VRVRHACRVTDVPYPDDIDRLVENIRTEINVQLGMARVELDQSVIENLAVGIASNIDYAFEFHWRPRWVHGGDAHRWTEASESGDVQHFVECLHCKRITAHATAPQGDAWYSQHVLEHA